MTEVSITQTGGAIVVTASVLGATGLSAYQVWLSAGNVGTETDFLNDISAGAVTATAANVTAAGAAQTAAEAAKTGAETAETDAQAAQAAAEAAQALAEAAKTLAETAETDAQTAETGAIAAKDAAVVAQAAAVAAQGAAETAETGSVAAKVAAEAAQVAVEGAETATAVDAAAASAYASAASSAKTAAEAAQALAETAETGAVAAQAAAVVAKNAAEAAETAAAADAVAAAASLSSAEGARDTALSYRDTTLGYRDTAEAHKDSAAVSAALAAAEAAGIVGYDLSAIADTITATAVDVFVYDTTQDSDGGAWRNRCQHTSWYNEPLNTATRGARQEFPVKALIVATASTVTIYDLDDPALPMWVVFNQGFKYSIHSAAPLTSVYMLNGELRVGSAGSGIGNLSEISFPADKSGMRVNSTTYYYIRSALSLRNTYVAVEGTISAGLVNREINDVTMTVLPDAPIDPATGLPVPTIAVATNGGVSVIKDDGTVVDFPSSTGAAGYVCRHVAFDEVGNFYANHNYSDSQERISTLWYFDASTLRDKADEAAGYANGDVNFGASASIVPNLLRSAPKNNTGGHKMGVIQPHKKDEVSVAALEFGLSRLALARSSVASSMVAYASSAWSTGWLPGDIKGAFLSDTDDTDLVGSGELVTTGWTGVNGAALTAPSGVLRVTSGGTANPYATQTVTLVVGKTYKVTAEIKAISGVFTARVDIDTSGVDGAGNVIGFTSVPATGEYTFTATSTSATLQLYNFSAVASDYVEFDNISVKLADADRSVNNNGLIVNGTVTRTPVATGAELVAYSGFSASNYLEQPYNADLDFGTGDFCVMGWAKFTGTATEYIFIRRDVLSAGEGPQIYVSNGNITFGGTTGGTISTPSTYNTGGWFFVSCVRQSGVLKTYVNGDLVVSGANVADLSNTTAVSRLGVTAADTAPLANGSLALWRISATAPTAEQIAKIYNDEKYLFQDNAACTLYGASDAVTALAHDPVTDLLHVGTSGGMSSFRGLQRVEQDTTAVTTTISANGATIARQ